MWPNPQEPGDLVTFTEEILNGKLHFLCSVWFEGVCHSLQTARQLCYFSNTLLIQLILLLFVSYYLVFIKDVAVKLRSYLGALVKSRERIEVNKIMVRLTVMAKSYLSNLSRVKAEFRWNLQLIALLFAASYFS